MALVAKLPETNSQFGLPARPSLARQMPPPAAPTYTGQAPGLQVAPMPMAVTRPDTTNWVPSPSTFRTPGWVALLGPISCHAPGECGAALRAAQPFCAAIVESIEI